MNDSVIRQGNNPYFVAIAAAVVGAVLGSFGATYNTNYAAQIANQASVQSSQSAELRDDGREIIQLKAAVTNDESELNVTKSDVRAIEQNMNSLLTAVDRLTEASHGIQKQVGDMDHWLRPDPSISGTPHPR